LFLIVTLAPYYITPVGPLYIVPMLPNPVGRMASILTI